MQRNAMLLAAVALMVSACGGSAASTTTTSAVTTTTAAATSTTAAANPDRVAQDGDTVAVHYVGSLDDGTVFDSSREREPLSFEVGTDQVIEGFDNAVRGMKVGEVKTVRIPPEEAYGPVDPELIFSVPIEEAPDDVAVGDEVLIGGVTTGRVVEVTATEVKIDTNHLFAGQALTFEIELMSIN
jgi:FKBP-type peptidyl-prolyl cis-trans isomerase 2